MGSVLNQWLAPRGRYNNGYGFNQPTQSFFDEFEVTNPENMDIFAFTVDEDLSYAVEIFNDGTTTLSQKIRKIRMNMRGRLVVDNTIVRRIEDVIAVRNDLLL